MHFFLLCTFFPCGLLTLHACILAISFLRSEEIMYFCILFLFQYAGMLFKHFFLFCVLLLLNLNYCIRDCFFYYQRGASISRLPSVYASVAVVPIRFRDLLHHFAFYDHYTSALSLILFVCPRWFFVYFLLSFFLTFYFLIASLLMDVVILV